MSARENLIVVVVALLSGTGAGACSPGGTAPANKPDASSALGLGEPCDPSLRAPCVTLTDVCSVSVCDPASRVCVRVAADAGPTCSNGPPPSYCPPGGCDGGSDAGPALDGAPFDAPGEAAEPDAAIDSGDDAPDEGDAGDGALGE
jgi:hypothetical protein